MHKISSKQKTTRRIIVMGLLVCVSFLGFTSGAHAQTTPVRAITFPVIGSVTYYDDFGAPRVGHAHEGNDLMGKKMLPLVAAVNGTVVEVVYPEATWGYSITIRDGEGYTYHYLHMNNDIPGTDNDLGGGMNAYAVDMKPGNKVVAGQLVGWMGDSGNAETTQAHLHFEIRLNGVAFSPYQSLKAATKITAPVDNPVLADEILPFGGFTGGANIAAGNLDIDTDTEIVAGAGAGGGPNIQVFDRNIQAPKNGFFAYDKTFRGGVDVAVADVDGDGVGEIIAAPGKGGGPNIKVFNSAGVQLASFMAYPSAFTGGVKVAAADLNGDGKAEIITAPASGGGPHVKIFQSNGALLGQFMAYDEGFKGGVDVSAASGTAGNSGLIATSPNTGGGPHIKIFSTDALSGSFQSNFVSEFLAYDSAHRGGVRVALSTSSSGTQIITVPLLGGPDIRKFDVNGNKLSNDNNVFEEWWNGSWDVANYNNQTFISTGPNTKRRTSVREADFQSRRSFSSL